MSELASEQTAQRDWHPRELVRPRTITGMAAVLLPFAPDGKVDWDAFSAHLLRTAEAGLTPAVNMDTGYVHLLDEATRTAVLDRAAEALGGRPFVAGAYVADDPGDPFRADRHLHAMDEVSSRGAIPVVFPSFGLQGLAEDELVPAFTELATRCDRFLAFELSPAFSPAGRIWALDTWRGLLDLPPCIGAKHSSLHRQPEWDRLRLRDERRPAFTLLTGNDLAIDMVVYGSDYLLGLATFAPDLFARRDALWAAGDPAFHEMNDGLQALGAFAFRAPVPAYRHSAATFLELRGWAGPDAVHPDAPRRPDADREVLRTLGEALGVL